MQSWSSKRSMKFIILRNLKKIYICKDICCLNVFYCITTIYEELNSFFFLRNNPFFLKKTFYQIIALYRANYHIYIYILCQWKNHHYLIFRNQIQCPKFWHRPLNRSFYRDRGIQPTQMGNAFLWNHGGDWRWW